MLRRTRKDVPKKLEHAKARRWAVKKSCWGIALMLLLVCAGYWLKCQLGFNFFNSVSISSYFPFNFLTSDVLSAKEPGVAIDEDFDPPRIFNQWSDSTFHHNYKATSKVIEGGYGDLSHCLQIISEGNQRWSYPFSKFISVTIGDVFHFEGLVYLKSDAVAARLCIAAFDENRKAIDWDLAVQGTDKAGAWVKVQKQFTIADGHIRYITFRVTGARGVYRFDNLLLNKLK
jgi:hypothetical protein